MSDAETIDEVPRVMVGCNRARRSEQTTGWMRRTNKGRHRPTWIEIGECKIICHSEREKAASINSKSDAYASTSNNLPQMGST